MCFYVHSSTVEFLILLCVKNVLGTFHNYYRNTFYLKTRYENKINIPHLFRKGRILRNM